MLAVRVKLVVGLAGALVAAKGVYAIVLAAVIDQRTLVKLCKKVNFQFYV